jgi:uncharacterized protein DUF955
VRPVCGTEVFTPPGFFVQELVEFVHREANVFGAELLMPEAAVRDAWAAFPDRDELAEHFGVSALAAQWRLYSFGLAERPASRLGINQAVDPRHLHGSGVTS